MQDELDILKKDWQRQGARMPKLSYEELYRMLLKKSSSIVKWIFYISIIEFLFWTSLNFFFTDKETWDMFRTLHIYEFTIALTIVSYLVLFYFIYMFYTNYRRISVTDSAKALMKNILEVRRTVTQYVWFNISIFAISLVTSIYGVLRYGPESQEILLKAENAGNEMVFWLLVIGICFAFVVALLLLLWLFYRILYGLLLKRLRRNYNELKKMEI